MLWLLPFLGQTLAAPTSEVTHCGSVSTSDGLVQLVASEQCYTLATGAALEYFTSGCDCVFYESSDCSGDADYGLAENWFQRGGDFKSYACVHGGSHMTQNTGGDLGIETKSDPKTAYSQNRLYKDAIYYQDHNLQGDCRTEDKATVRDNACRDVLGLSDTPSHTSQDGSSTELVVRQDSSSVLVICTEVGFRVCGTIDKAILGTCANAPEEYRDKIKSLKMAAGTTCALYPSMGCGGRARVILGGTEITQLADLKAQGTTVNSYKCARNKVRA
jgi:hypothetical protein